MTRKILLNGGENALVDDDIYELVKDYTWGLNQEGYVRRVHRDDGRFHQVLLHRFVMDAPAHLIVDHADGVRTNCQRYNLRFCTKRQNVRNSVQHQDSKSPYKGIYKHAGDGKWVGQISVNGRRVRLGRFFTAEEAARAYDAAARKYFGEFACVNFPSRTERSARVQENCPVLEH